MREGLQAQVNLSTASIGIARTEQGDARGVQDLERAASALRQANAYLDLARVLLWLAYAQYVTGQIDQAKETLVEMARHGRRLGCRPFSLAEGRRLAGFLTWGVEQLPQEAQLRSWIAQLAEKPMQILETAPQAAQMPRLEVRAFGPGQVWREGELLTTAHWGRSANARELFFYLLEHSPSRKEDIGLNFWPDLSMARMTSSFHAAKYRARRALGVEFVVYDDERYRLNPLLPLSYDVAEFRRLIEASRQAATDVERVEWLRQAVQLYTGDYLTDVGADWAAATRAELHRQFFEALGYAGRDLAAPALLRRGHRPLPARPRDRLFPREFASGADVQPGGDRSCDGRAAALRSGGEASGTRVEDGTDGRNDFAGSPHPRR